jgi:hypothetical protein
MEMEFEGAVLAWSASEPESEAAVAPMAVLLGLRTTSVEWAERRRSSGWGVRRRKYSSSGMPSSS